MMDVRWKILENRHKPVKALEYVLLQFEPARSLYWQHVPSMYRRWYRHSYQQMGYRCPIDPFKVCYVDPATIQRITGRSTALLYRASLGSVRDGDWDLRGKSNWDGTEPHKPAEAVFSGTFFCETIFYQSLKRHFDDGVAWSETELYNEFCRGLQHNETVLNGRRTEREILERLFEIDNTYRRIRDTGYQPQSSLRDSNSGFKSVGYLGELTNEVCLDIGRDGELLFVDGKHRLAIAKILGLDAIPVIFLTRHTQWMDRREQVYFDRADADHPDLRALFAHSEA